MSFEGSAAQIADHALEVSGPLAKAKRVARELTSPKFRISCYMMTRYTSPRIFVEIKGKDTNGERFRQRHAFRAEQDAIDCMRREHAAFLQNRQQPFEVTDADIEAGELEFEINEALRTAFPGTR